MHAFDHPNRADKMIMSIISAVTMLQQGRLASSSLACGTFQYEAQAKLTKNQCCSSRSQVHAFEAKPGPEKWVHWESFRPTVDDLVLSEPCSTDSRSIRRGQNIFVTAHQGMMVCSNMISPAFICTISFHIRIDRLLTGMTRTQGQCMHREQQGSCAHLARDTVFFRQRAGLRWSHTYTAAAQHGRNSEFMRCK